MSPTTICTGISSAASVSPTRSTRAALRCPTPRSTCQADRPIRRNAQVSAEASSMCAKRYGNEGLKITASQLATWNSPFTISWPAGVCIHELSARIQKAESVVPKATMKVDIRCTRSPTLPWPNSITPRKPASRKNAVSTS
ncbi:hypothetical protein D9M72_348930 [compost metagenome]